MSSNPRKTTNLNKVVTKGVTTTEPFSSYVGHSGEVTVNAPAAQISIHDGVTPGGLPLGGYTLAGPFTAGNPNGQLNGPVLTPNAYNIVDTLSNNGDSVTLPPAIAGTVVFVMVPNGVAGSNTLSIWPNGSDSIDGLAGDYIDYGSSVQSNFGAAGLATFICLTTGAWYTNTPLD